MMNLFKCGENDFFASLLTNIILSAKEKTRYRDIL